jgi:hypothetical protein
MCASHLGWNLAPGAPPVARRAAAWWTTEAHRLDGLVPGFLVDVAGGRHMLAGASVDLSALMTNANTSTSATRIDAGGVLRLAAAGELRLDHRSGVPELLLEGPLTNKLTCRKHAPIDTANLTLSGAGATLAVVSDTAALTAAGLGAICADGKVYELDNSAGGSTAQVVVTGAVANTNPHSVGAWVRGTGSFQIDLDQGTPTTVACPAAYELRVGEAIVPAGTANQFRLTAAAGSRVKFVLPQLVEASVHGSTIPGDTLAAITRTADLVALTSTAAAVLQGAGAAVAFRGSVPVAVANGQLIGLPTANALVREGGSGAAANLALQGAASSLLIGLGVVPGTFGVCAGWGASGRNASVGAAATVEDAVTMTSALTAIYLGRSNGLVAGQILRLRQLLGWSLADRPSAASVQFQARSTP